MSSAPAMRNIWREALIELGRRKLRSTIGDELLGGVSKACAPCA